MNRDLRLIAINQLRDKYAPHLGEIMDTDQENPLVAGMVSEWEEIDRHESTLEEIATNPEYTVALEEFVNAVRHAWGPVSVKQAFDIAIQVLHSRGWAPRPQPTDQRQLFDR